MQAVEAEAVNRLLSGLTEQVHSDNPHLLSHTILGDFHLCERKFELNRLIINDGYQKDEKAYHIRGTAYGVGVQVYLITGDMDLALICCWLAYSPELEDLNRRPFISMARTLNNLLLSKDKLDYIRSRYKVAIFNGKYAAELSFKINIDGKWFYVGHIDLVLYDTQDKVYIVLDTKTSNYNIEDLTPLYQNSGQCLGYSVALDAIVGEELSKYGVMYFVCRDKSNTELTPDLFIYSFAKTLVDRLKWFYTIGMDVERLEKMDSLGIFPQRGNSCISFGRKCNHFNFCQLTATDIKKQPQIDSQAYDFTFNLQDLISNHLERVRKLNG